MKIIIKIKNFILQKILMSVRRNSFQRRLIIYVAVVISVLIGISIVFSGVYFSRLMENQLMQDYSELLKYSSSQIYSYFEDIHQHAVLIATDEQLQEILSRGYQPTSVILKKYRINGILKPYAMLEPSLITIELQTQDGIVYSSEQANRIIDRENDINRKLTPTNSKGFTKARVINYSNQEWRVISYVLPINNYYDWVENTAVLFLNIDYDKFGSKIRGNLTDFNWISLHTSDGSIIYYESTNQMSEVQISDRIREIMGSGNQARTDDHEIILQNPIGVDGMMLTISLTDADIMKEIRTIHFFFLRLFIVALIISVIGVCLVTVRVTASIRKVTVAARGIAEGKKDVYVDVKGNDEVTMLANVFNDMVASINLQMKQISEAEKEKNQLKMDILMTQINPHFIYNTLNSAIYLCQLGDNDQAVQLIRDFVKLLQDNMKSGVEGVIAEIGEEEACIRNYLEIQSIRYPRRFVSHVEVEDEIRTLHIPRLILQPFVENSLNHGILTEEKMGEIRVSITKRDDYIRILIRDNGLGMDEAMVELINRFEKGKSRNQVHSIGISNVNERLKLMYHESYRLRILSDGVGSGTTVEILLPIYFGQELL